MLPRNEVYLGLLSSCWHYLCPPIRAHGPCTAYAHSIVLGFVLSVGNFHLQTLKFTFQMEVLDILTCMHSFLLVKESCS